MAHLFSATTSDEKKLSNTANQKPSRYGNMELMMDHQSFPKDKPILEFYLLFYKFSLFFHVRKKLEIVALGYMNANFGKMAQETKTIINLHQNL